MRPETPPCPARRLVPSHQQVRLQRPGCRLTASDAPRAVAASGAGPSPRKETRGRGGGRSSLPARGEFLSWVRSRVQHRRWKRIERTHRTPSSPAARPRPPRGRSGLTPGKPGSTANALRGVAVTRATGAEVRLPPGVSRASCRMSPEGAEMTIRSGKSGFRWRRIVTLPPPCRTSKNPKWRHRHQTSRAIGRGANARPRGPLVTEGVGQTGRLRAEEEPPVLLRSWGAPGRGSPRPAGGAGWGGVVGL